MAEIYSKILKLLKLIHLLNFFDQVKNNKYLINWLWCLNQYL